MGRDEHWEEIELFDSYFLALIVFGVVGRVVYVLLNWGEMGTLYRTLAVLAFPGFNVIAGVVGSILLLWTTAGEHEWEIPKMLDAWSVAISVAAVFFAIGGLLNGSSGVIAIDGWSLGWSLMTFLTLSRIRKNFRFYSWYRGNASVAKDGLASYAGLVLAGIWGIGAGIILKSWVYGGVGMGIVILGITLIYNNIGHKGNVWINLLQWLKSRRK